MGDRLVDTADLPSQPETVRTIVRKLTVLGCAAAMISLSAAGYPAPPDADEPPGNNVTTVDFSEPALAAELLGSAQNVDNAIINATGLAVADPEARRQRDAELSRGDTPVAPARCPDLPTGPRSTDGSTTPYLGCAPATGEQFTLPSMAGTASVVRSLDLVLARRVGTSVPGFRASRSGADVVVDLPERAARLLSRLSDAEGAAVHQSLLFTAHSNGAVRSIRFQAAGSCLRYALSVGGDQCVTHSLPIVVRVDAP